MPEELDALLAPIALYPDTLLAQMCIASTYPLEIVHAARWQKDNANLQGAALNTALDMQPWDASVKGLVQTPTVLQQMSEKLEWTQKLGDAFLGQQSDVMASIQRLRARALEKGQLMSTPQQTVTTTGTGTSQIIVIQQANPEVIYVPAYDPGYVYGDWPYPAYPPYPYYPYAGVGLAFGLGILVGGAIWDNGWNWGGGNVQVNPLRNNNINNNFDRNNIGNRQNWNHQVEHRGGVNYRDQATGERFGRGDAAGTNARQNFRGFDQGQLGQRTGGQLGQGNVANRASFEQRGGFNGLSDAANGAQTRSHAQRGASSRASSSRSFGGGARAGGGGFRGGGGGGGRR
jgi:hypothetical protein